SEQLGNLQSKLSETGESATESYSKLQANVGDLNKTVKEHGSEIRKLWDLSNKGNKDAIAANDAAIKKQAQSVQSTQASLAELKKTVAGYDEAIRKAGGQAEAVRKQLDSAVKSVNDSNAQLRTQVGQLQTQVDVLVDSLKQLEQQSKNQQTAISRLQ